MTNAEHTSPKAVESKQLRQPRTATGQFVSHYVERRGNAIALRLPQSLDHQLRETVGWQSKADNRALTAWVEAAILEKLERQQNPE
ncbi:MAG: hypothetical protein AAGE59_37660 [Cyanobacteria bacterium P01_F01_bin.86]